MIPSVIASEVRTSVEDFLRTTFRHSTHRFEKLMDNFLADPENCFKGPYVSVALPFRPGDAGPNYFPDVPLAFPPHRHQELAFNRLKAPYYRSTLIATGTGSGKTECFLQPILEHCFKHRDTPGIKALLIYPMNALATDQAKRIASAIYNNPNLRGQISAGLFVGESEREPKAVMSEDSILTDKNILRHHPPDILLTNYKMLDYLLVRPGDKSLWASNSPETLRYLVVDEIHTFDGAQGTDLACLIRRLKARLQTPENHLACVGTSATLGGGGDNSAKAAMLQYAEGVFAESFEGDAVVEEDRLSPDEFLQGMIRGSMLDFLTGDRLINTFPEPEDLPILDPTHYDSQEAYIRAQHQLWLGRPLVGDFNHMDWRIALGSDEGLISLRIVLSLLPILAEGAVDLEKLWERLGQRIHLSKNAARDYRQALLNSLLALMAMARRRASDAPDSVILPWVNLRVQFWQRELRRMVATVEAEPKLVFADDQTADDKAKTLPVLNCRECGSTGWGGLRRKEGDRAIACDLKDFYVAYFNHSPLSSFVFPTQTARPDRPNQASPGSYHNPAQQKWTWAKLCTKCLSLNQGEGDTCTVCGHDDLLAVLEPDVVQTTTTRQGKNIRKSSHDCPFCGAHNGLSILGSRAASLSSVVIGTLFASSYNQDRKLITFSDSVQDAAHRAGFFGARTFRTTLRTALYQYLEYRLQQHPQESQSLQQVVSGFQDYWRSHFQQTAPTAHQGDADYIATFIPTDMQWLGEWEQLQQDGTLSPNLLELIQKRIDWEIVADLGLRSTIGRSLERIGACSVQVDPQPLQATVTALLPRLQNEIGALQTLDANTLHRFLLGLLRHLRLQGGIFHSAAKTYIEQGGKSFLLQRPLFMPGFGPSSRVPTYFSDQCHEFEALLKSSGKPSWCSQWAFKHFFDWDNLNLVAAQFDALYELTLEELVNQKILTLHHTHVLHRVWGLEQSALQVQAQAQQLACDHCHDLCTVHPDELSQWQQMRCLQPHCEGHYQPLSQPLFAFYKNLYGRGEVWRIFAQEHTGLLEREVREQLENRFINGDRRSDPNLLSATSTLEMGINIGDLSSTLLCSVPPAQANYHQRMGRAGRRDGNAFVGAIANGRPHDLYFWSDPLEKMIRSSVTPPGFYLNASAILQRQLTAYCLDRWVAEEAQPQDIPDKFSSVLNAVKTQDKRRFPYPWLAFIETNQTALLEQFLQLFDRQLDPNTQTQLQAFMEKGNLDEGGLRWRILNRLLEVVDERQKLQNQISTLKRRIDTKKTAPKSLNHEEELNELIQERSGLQELVKKLNAKNTLNFLTDEGLLPNYAFPEAGVTLKSIIWRQRTTQGDSQQGKYVTQTFEYERPGQVAIGELAPAGSFYAEGRRVEIDQIDLNLSKIEEWRFCSSCSFASLEALEPAKQKSCPRCGDQGWSDVGRKRKMVRLRQVMATTSDRSSRIADDRDERTPAFFTKQLLADFEPTAREETYVLEDEEFPFGFEFIAQTTFREVNFGETNSYGENVAIAGQTRPRSGFKVCTKCGKVQTSKNINRFKHTLACNAKDQGDEDLYLDLLYLFREFESESLRILMPVDVLNFPGKLHSFIAALQMGLKQHFKGSVDHLRVLISEDPQPNSTLRRPYLFLYDTVPGGTGYLKQLLRSSSPSGSAAASDKHPGQNGLMQVLETALHHLEDCGCDDGCYNCLFAYRNSFNQDKTSRNEAIAILKTILSRKDKLKRSEDSLSGVELNALFDSVLERRFIEALRRYRYREQPTILNREMVNGKPGYFIKLGGQTWNIEPQVELGANEGVAVPSRADFVLWPVRNGARLKPVVVFTDGWEYHRDRLGKDFLQRMAIAQSGRFRVWSLTWSDVEAQFHQQVHQQVHQQGAAGYTNLLELDVNGQMRSKEQELYRRYGCSILNNLLTESSFEWLAHYLAEPDDAAWTGWALARSFLQLNPQAQRREWIEAVRSLVGDDLADSFELETSQSLLGQITVNSTEGVPWVKTYLAADRNKHIEQRSDSTVVVTWIDDRDVAVMDRPMTLALNQAWSGVLRQFNLMQFLDHSYVVAETSYRQLQPELALLRPTHTAATATVGTVLGDMWQEILEFVTEEARPLIEQLAQVDAPVPEVGYELEDAEQGVAIAEAELAWPDKRIALLLDESAIPLFQQAGWRAELLTQTVTNIDLFIDQTFNASNASTHSPRQEAA